MTDFPVVDWFTADMLELMPDDGQRYELLDVRFSDRMQLQPDMLVVPLNNLTGDRVDTPPLLVVEVFSPSTRGRDQVLKRSAYERAGVPSYWLIDPELPSLTALELADGGYVQVAHVEGERAWTAERPFPMTVAPADLVR